MQNYIFSENFMCIISLQLASESSMDVPKSKCNRKNQHTESFFFGTFQDLIFQGVDIRTRSLFRAYWYVRTCIENITLCTGWLHWLHWLQLQAMRTDLGTCTYLYSYSYSSGRPSYISMNVVRSVRQLTYLERTARLRGLMSAPIFYA